MWPISCRYGIPKQATLNHWEMAPNAVPSGMFLQRSSDSLTLASAALKKTLGRSSSCQQAHFFSDSSHHVFHQGPRNTLPRARSGRALLCAWKQREEEREVASHAGTRKQGWLPLARNDPEGTPCYVGSLEKSNLTNFDLKVIWFYVKSYQDRSHSWITTKMSYTPSSYI